MERLEERTMFLYKANHIILRNLPPVDANPFAKVHQVRRGVKPHLEVHQVRRGVKPHLVTALLQDSSQQMADRTLSVRSCNVNCVIITMWIA